MSDSEEAIVISDGEEENYPPPQTPVFRTPYSTPAFWTPYGTPRTPNSGIVFWGSPYDERKQHVRKVPRKKAVMDRSPLIQRVTCTPSGEHKDLYTDIHHIHVLYMSPPFVIINTPPTIHVISMAI